MDEGQVAASDPRRILIQDGVPRNGRGRHLYIAYEVWLDALRKRFALRESHGLSARLISTPARTPIWLRANIARTPIMASKGYGKPCTAKVKAKVMKPRKPKKK